MFIVQIKEEVVVAVLIRGLHAVKSKNGFI